MSVHSSQRKSDVQRKRLSYKIIMYNCIENSLLFVIMLNSVIYPSASFALYYLFALGITALSLSKDNKTIKLKFILSIALAVSSITIAVGKGLILIKLNN